MKKYMHGNHIVLDLVLINAVQLKQTMKIKFILDFCSNSFDNKIVSSKKSNGRSVFPLLLAPSPQN